ncbi:ABC transporter permease [Candidatus Woesearchaeota archaeon]|nr:ABC transporter permease [Candidatus Woesearchaeota archaeon]USN44199.1 MAG: ABC transporter permease [Candidatus Woesearchaeota archaeon]
MISVGDLLLLVYRNMVEKKKRVFLTIAGIIIGIFTFTFFIFLSQGLSNAITNQFSSFGLNVLGVQSISGTNQNGPPGGGDLTDSDVAKIRQVVRDYKYISPQIFYMGQYEHGREKGTIISLAYPDSVIDDIAKDLGFEVEEGRDLRAGDKGIVVLGAKAARDTFDTELKVGDSLKIKGRSFRIVGILKERGDLFIDSSLRMSTNDLKEISGLSTYTVVRVSFYEGADLEANKEAILRKLNPFNGEKRVQITSPQQVIDQFNSILGVLQAIISTVSIIAVIVGGINVMNTMYSSVLERINEISVMKALGAENSDIRLLFLAESGVLGLTGALLGFMMAFALAKIASFGISTLGYTVPVFFDWTFFALVIFVTTFFAMLFGTYPAIQASSVNPADNLRDE